MAPGGIPWATPAAVAGVTSVQATHTPHTHTHTHTHGRDQGWMWMRGRVPGRGGVILGTEPEPASPVFRFPKEEVPAGEQRLRAGRRSAVWLQPQSRLLRDDHAGKTARGHQCRYGVGLGVPFPSRCSLFLSLIDLFSRRASLSHDLS